MLYQDTFVGLSVDEINEIVSSWSLGPTVAPFARDQDKETILCLFHEASGANTVKAVNAADGEVEEDFGVSYGQYLEQLRQKLLTGKLVYDETMGLISVA